MSVLVRIGRHKAILRLGHWVAADLQLEDMLNRTTEAWIRETGGPPLSDPDHERAVAGEIAARVGGRVMLRLKPITQRAAGVYARRRQLNLF